MSQPDAQGEQLMADPYAGSGSTASPAAVPQPTFGGFGSSTTDDLHLNASSSEPLPTPDFLFPESFDEKFRRSWGERLTFHVGSAYLVGLVGGGGAGFYQGLRDSAGERQRIRINSVLNATGKRGPGLGNTLGCIAMMCSIFESIAYNVRGEDDLLNPAGAAALTGALYKITAGPRAAAAAALGLSAITTAGTFITQRFSGRGALKFF